jgi:5-oxoprolinase (ATP-hydrolysing) subunit A
MGPVPVDLNADVGESYGRWRLGNDEAMLHVVTSANVACGFHAGDPATLLRTCQSAQQRGVVIGAQVGYPDLAGFGRRFLDMAPDDLTAAVIYQVGALEGLARSVGTRVRYVKPHGALYNTVVEHEGQATAVVRAVIAYDPTLPVVGLPGSAFLRIAAEEGLRPVREYFVDRAYTADGRLLDRREPGAVLDDAEFAADRAVRAALGGAAESFCTHGDSPGAVAMAQAVRAALTASDIEVAPFVAAPEVAALPEAP